MKCTLEATALQESRLIRPKPVLAPNGTHVGNFKEEACEAWGAWMEAELHLHAMIGLLPIIHCTCSAQRRGVVGKCSSVTQVRFRGTVADEELNAD